MSWTRLARAAPGLLAAALAAAGALWLAPLGLALSPDGAHYMNVALRLAYDGLALIEPKYPIGYPLLVRVVMPFEPFPVDAAFWVSIVSFGATLAGVGSLARRVTASATWSCMAVLGCAFFVPVWNGHLYALSEAPFTALLVLHAACVARHLEVSRGDARRGLHWFALAALCVGASAVVRVIGYAVIAAFSAYALVWIVAGARSARTRMRLVALHALSYLPALGIASANLAAGRAAHGDRPSAQAADAFGSHFERAIATLSSDLGPAWIATLAASLVAYVVYLQRSSTGPGGRSGAAPDGARLYLYLVAIVAIYVPVLLVGASLTRISPIGTRFLMPVYPIVVVLLLGVASFAPAPLRKLGAVLSALSFAHAIGLGVPELGRANAGFASTASQRTATHLAVGYDASPSAQAVRAFLAEVARGGESAGISSLFPMPRGGQHARLARALLLRGSSVASAGEDVRFDLAAADALEIALGGGPARLHYADLAITGQDSLDPQTLLAALLDVMRKTERRDHWLLTPAPGDPLRATGELVAGPLVIRERRTVGGFRAYLFSLRGR